MMWWRSFGGFCARKRSAIRGRWTRTPRACSRSAWERAPVSVTGSVTGIRLTRPILLLGKTTDTEDISGTVLTERQVTVSEEEVREIILSFVGGYDQIPPMYSAKKVGGRKLYELAREGVVIERKACPVRLYDIVIREIALPYVTFSVRCSKGLISAASAEISVRKPGAAAVWLRSPGPMWLSLP